MSSKSASKSQGTVLWRVSKKFNFAAEKILPESFVFCVILMLVVFVLSLFCGKTPLSVLPPPWMSCWTTLSATISFLW